VANAKAAFVRLEARSSSKSSRLGLGGVLATPRLWALTAAVAGAVTFGCGTPHAILDIGAPSNATAGSPFTVTVTAMVGGSRDTAINTAIHFTSSDSTAVLPADYYFNAADAGSHTFTNGATLMTAGNQSITATEVGVPGLNGTVYITVSAPIVAQLTANESSHSFRQTTHGPGRILPRTLDPWPPNQRLAY
jgi:hypothetical protein